MDLGSNGGTNGYKEWGNLYLAEGGQISIGGSVSPAVADALDVTLTQVDPTIDNYSGERGLILNTNNWIFFDDATNYDQYIGSKTADGGITVIAAPAEIEVDGGVLVDVDGESVTIDASGASGIGLTAATGDVTLTTTDAAKKVILNTGTAAIFSHTSDANDEDFTIEQLGAVDASLILSSAGTGTDGIKLEASAGGIDINAADAQDVAIAGGQITLASEENVASAISLTTNVGTSETIVLTNTLGTGLNAVDINASAGGFTIDGGIASTITTATQDLTLTADATDAKVVIKGDNENGAAVHIDADQNALSVVDIDAGEFNLTSSAATVVVAGAASSITTSAGDLTLTADADNSQVVIKGYQENGTAVHIDGDAVAASVVDIDAGILDVDVTGAANIATTGIAGDIAIVSAHTAGVAFHLDADADAASEVDIDAGILDVDVTGAANICLLYTSPSPRDRG